MFIHYNKMKAKQKTAHLNFSHWSRMFGLVMSMFEYTDVTDNNIDYHYLEKYLISDGVAFVGKVDGKLTAMLGSRHDDLNEYGLGTKINAVTQNGKAFTGTIGKDCVVIYNNNLHLPELELTNYADLLTELDKSVDLNIQYTRDYPIPIVETDRDKEVVKTAIKNMRDGVPCTIVGNSTLSDIINNVEMTKTLEISNPDRINNLQYLLTAYETIEKRFWARYGHNVSSTDKRAQVTETELTGTDSVSLVYPMIRLEERIKAIEELNQIFGTNIKVDFSKIWKKEEEKYERSVEDVEQEDIDPIPTSE